ncbi:hypothetical protein [Rufibacter roseus]|uniref:DUF3098 domain-containing protein n=1 Tax=Rufibacter roseus TaxID=1567108 RepID=A0ABW2DFW1_9BACT|nr:hypothetical protein [Rufibacter roseus]
MYSRIIFTLAIVLTTLGVATVFFEIPVLEEYPPFSMGFFKGFLFGLGPTLFVSGWVRRQKEREETAR